MNKYLKYIILILGITLLVFGFYILKSSTDQTGIYGVLPYIFIGLGCVLFAQGIGEIISNKALSEEHKKRIAIEKHDERNLFISNYAKAKAYSFMTYAYGALLISFAIMGMQLRYILLLAFTYLLVVGYEIYSRIKLEKEM